MCIRDRPSSGQPSVTLTAVASDSKGVVLKDVGVQFQVKSTEADGKTPNGTIQVITSVTDDKGVATASLSTGGTSAIALSRSAPSLARLWRTR